MGQWSTATILPHVHLSQLCSGISCQASPGIGALIYDYIAPSFLITLDRRRKKRVHNLAKRNQIVRPEQAAPRRNALKIVNAPQ